MKCPKRLYDKSKICSFDLGHDLGHDLGQLLFKLLIIIEFNLGHNIRQVFLNKVRMAGNIYQEISTVFISLDSSRCRTVILQFPLYGGYACGSTFSQFQFFQEFTQSAVTVFSATERLCFSHHIQRNGAVGTSVIQDGDSVWLDCNLRLAPVIRRKAAEWRPSIYKEMKAALTTSSGGRK